MRGRERLVLGGVRGVRVRAVAEQLAVSLARAAADETPPQHAPERDGLRGGVRGVPGGAEGECESESHHEREFYPAVGVVGEPRETEREGVGVRGVRDA